MQTETLYSVRDFLMLLIRNPKGWISEHEILCLKAIYGVLVTICDLPKNISTRKKKHFKAENYLLLSLSLSRSLFLSL